MVYSKWNKKCIILNMQTQKLGLFLFQKTSKHWLKMAMWADNVKFVKDIIDSKYQKIDSAIAEVIMENYVFESLAKRLRESLLK